MKRKTDLRFGLTLVLSLVAAACAADTAEDAPAQADEPQATATETGPETVASGLNGPMGVTVEPDGTIWVVDSGLAGEGTLMYPDLETHELSAMPFGESARLVRVSPDGTQTDMATMPSVDFGEEFLGASRVVAMGDALYITSGQWTVGLEIDRPDYMAALIRYQDGALTEVATTWPIERDENPAGALVETHPYGLAEGPDGMLWLADAAGNTLFRIDPASGDAEVVAVFDALPGPIPNPARDNAMEIEPVPTAVAFDASGGMYVSLLPGVPFLPGSAKVVRVTEDGAVSDYATDLTMLTDLQTGPDGNLYAVSMGVFTEQGPTPNSGSVIRIGEGATSEPVLTDLSFPTGLAFAANGDAYVTINGVGPPESGEVVKYSGLAGH
jgi:sugar lactone lactonase YvrE